MALIRKDALGLNVAAGGYIARPINPTSFSEGDQVSTHHFSGSIRAGVDKNSDCNKGEYVETWVTQGYSLERLRKWHKVRTAEDYLGTVTPIYEFYEEHARSMYPLTYGKGKP